MDSIKKTVYRRGKRVDIKEIVKSLEDDFISDIDETVCTQANYEDVSNETWSSLLCTMKAIEILEKLGYLFENEASAMKTAAKEKRLEVLRLMEVDNE